MQCGRYYSTAENTANTENPSTELEKKLQADNEKLNEQVKSLEEKSADLLVGFF